MIDLFPKSIASNLPKEAYKYYSCILFAYKELLRGDKLGLFIYVANDDKVILNNVKHYKRQKEKIIKDLEKYQLLLPYECEFQELPRHPNEIKKNLEKCIIWEADEDDIRLVIHALFAGVSNEKIDIKTKLAKKTQAEKFGLWFSKKLSSTKKR